jgi:DNA-binding transcriptional regulator YiaG
VTQSLADEVRSRPKLPVPAVRQAIRRKAEVAQDRMARELGVHRVTFLRWERGDRTPRGAQLDAYARLLRELDEATQSAA